MQPMVDTHCHLNFESYQEDRDAVVQRAIDAGVTRIIIPAIDAQTSVEALALADIYTGVCATVGIHPNDTADFSPTQIDTLRALAAHPKVVAVGEIGLDYYWDKSPKHKQREAFETQLTLAAELNLPVIIHDRDAHDDVIVILEAWANTLPPEHRTRIGVLHSCSAPLAITERALAIGFYLGFTGPLTFKKAEDLRQVAAATPLNCLLVETDGPFLTPEPYRGKRNEPSYIPYIVARLAAVHNLTPDAMALHTTQNAERLFGLR